MPLASGGGDDAAQGKPFAEQGNGLTLCTLAGFVFAD
jgi:hypothetical protein